MRKTIQNKKPFHCHHCGYESNLALGECPECGRLAPRAPRVTADSGAPADRGAPLCFSPPPAAEAVTALYECAHCRCRTRRARGECPECGRAAFAAREAPAAEAGDASPAPAPPATDRNELAACAFGFAVMFAYGAVEVFMGLEPYGEQSAGGGMAYTAPVGAHWPAALVLLIAGLVCGALAVHWKYRI